MYSISYYKEKDFKKVFEFMQAHPFIVMNGVDVNGLPVSTQVPVLLEILGETVVIKGHIMRQTDHHKAFEANPDLLCLFVGPSAYVSASWYSNQQVASTWNYATVHARGNIEFLDNEALLDILEKTTAFFENNPQSTASYKNLPETYIEQFAKAIIAFKIEIQSIEHVFKLSQNRDEASFKNIISKLHEQSNLGAKGVAEMMEGVDINYEL